MLLLYFSLSWGEALYVLRKRVYTLPEYKGNSYLTICSMFVATISFLLPYAIKQREPRHITETLSAIIHLGNKVPGAGIEPARVLPHWCLRPTRLPIPPSGLVRLGTKILQLLKVIHRQRKRSTLLPTLGYFKRCPDCSSEDFEASVR